MPRRWRGKRGEEDRNCDGKVHKRDIERVEKNGEKEQQMEEIGDC